MNTSDTTRRGIINQGAFFSPYYLFDLLARQHADELDPEGREANRRLLRRPFRAALARYGETGSTASQAWSAWYRELFEALGFLGHPEGPPLQRLDAPVETSRHGLVPISHAAFLTDDEGPTTGDGADSESRGTDHAPPSPLIFVDLHGFGTDLDRDYYSPSPIPKGHDVSNLQSPITEESIARAVEFALDYNQARWAIVGAGDRLRLYRKGGSVARQYLEVNFPALFDADRNDEWAAFWGLFRYQAFVPDPETGKCLLDRVLEESQRHASRIADDLRENIVIAVEALIQGILDDPANKAILAKLLPSPTKGRPPAGGRWVGGEDIQQLFEESLYFLYRLLFILYAESRDLLPVGESPVYRDTYSVEHLREMAERPLHAEDADKTYYIQAVRALFQMLHHGFPPPSSALNPGFEIPPFNGQLFGPERTALLDRCRVPDRAMRQVIRELSLSRPRRRGERRERYSYADLGVDQLGSIYEGLLVYEPAIVDEETVVAKVKGEERLVSRAQAEEYGLEMLEDSLRRPGSFVLRLWGGRRKGSGSYYTPQEITSFLVKEALEPLVEPIVQGCARRDKRGRPKRRPEEILEIKVCDPAMGSGAFLIQACRYLAEAYGRARIAAGLDEDERISQEEFAHYKRRVAEKCLYGVDLNPLAVELAKVSLWLETLARDRPLTFLDAHLRCGNSLVGAPLRDEEGDFSVERISLIPDEALKEVSKEATQEQKAAARERIKCNREETKQLQGQKGGQALLPGVDWGILSWREVETALTDILSLRLDLEASDEELPMTQAVELVQEKEHMFDTLLHSADSRYRLAKQMCDLWCAAWFWPEPGSEIEVGEDGHNRIVVVPEPPTTQVFLEMAGSILGTDPGSLSPAEREAYLLTVDYVAQQQHFFHWELEFPEVWREKGGQARKRGGFEAVIGNPPWDVIEAKTKEFYSNFDALFPFYKKQEAVRIAEDLRSGHLSVDTAWREYEHQISATSRWAKGSGMFKLAGSGKVDTYKLFTEVFYSRIRKGGYASLIVPTGIYTDQGAAELRKVLFRDVMDCRILSFDNRGQLFPIHRWAKFVLLTFCKVPEPSPIKCAFLLGKDLAGQRRAPDARELPVVLSNLADIQVEVTEDLIEEFDPEVLSIPEFKSPKEVQVSQAIGLTFPKLGQTVEDQWNISFGSDREFNTTSDSAHFLDNDRRFAEAFWQKTNQDVLPLVEGRCVAQHSFTAKRWVRGRGRAAVWQDTPPISQSSQTMFWNPQFWVRKDFCRRHFGDSYLNDNWRVGFCKVGSPENERTVIASVLPDSVYTMDSVQLIYIEARGENALVPYYLSGVLNSFVADFLIRMKVNLNLSLFFVATLPVPRRGSQVRTIAELSEGLVWHPVYAENLPRFFPIPTVATVRDIERARIRAEIDALVADLYGLSEEDFAYILSTFPLLDRNMPPLPGEPKSFITRDLALLALFKLRGKAPPADIVDFFAAAWADIRAITGPLRDLEERVVEATRLGAVAYIPSGRGGEIEVEPEEAVVQLGLFEE